MTIQQAVKSLTTQLHQIYDHREAVNITSMVMEKITDFSTSERLIYKHTVLTAAQQGQLQNFTRQLLQHKPVQYVLKEAWFAGLRFYVDENVLIPRPETEELVETIIDDMQRSPGKVITMLDIGTGSGCIPVSIKKKLPEIAVYALDISEEALDIAQKNAAFSKVDINFFQADILHFQQEATFPPSDIIVSNPPYIKQTEAAGMSPNVLMYEPHLALFVPDENAMVFYEAIADFSLQHLNSHSGKLFFEINELMGEQVTGMLMRKGFSEVSIKKDLQGKNRMVLGVLNKQEDI